jgi:hypothetical protein
MLELPVGTTRGPGETPGEFTFITRDPSQRIKHGEFVFYRGAVDGQDHEILARVSDRQPVRLYPDTFLADPAVAPETIGRLLGYDHRSDLFVITAAILGYYDAALGLVNPRVPPPSGTPIHVVPDGVLHEVLCKRRPGERGAVHIGSLLSRGADAVPVTLDARGFTSTHLAIIASTGSGKSYLAGVILEELMMPHTRAAVLVIDPHAEYHTLAEMENDARFAADGYRPTVTVVTPERIKVRASSLTIGDLRYLLPQLSERMDHVLSQAYRSVRREKGDKWTRAELLVEVRGFGKGKQSGDEEDLSFADEQDPSVAGLEWRIDSILNQSRLFDDFRSLPLEDLVHPGQCTVLQLNEIPEREQQIVVATLLRRIDQARRDTTRQRAKAGDENYLPSPVFVMIEEAHTFAPANAQIITTNILKQILSEGRKFGIAVGLISQRPGRLDADVLSQCMTQCIMRVVNPIDQARIAESVESVGRDLLLELPALSKGQVIVAGASVNTPLLARVRPRLTPHFAQDPDSPAEWTAYFCEAQTARRERDDAPPADVRPAARPRPFQGDASDDDRGLPF